MSLRKFMHPRNKYRNEPDFKKLAVLYPEFRKIITVDLTGKVRINFRDEESLRVLAKTLLKHDFELEVEIPLHKLVPAMPLRLNYILWIEDLLKHSGIDDLTSIHGIDIGTGAVCIYPLLCYKMFQCKMTCSDINAESVKSATENIVHNNLQDFIKVILVNKETILKEVFNDGESYSFVMCNPPFFKTDEDTNKTSKKLPPRNAPTGNDGELIIEGGEKEFVQRLIEESIQFKERVKIFTTMFGQKSSLSFLRSELAKRNIVNTTWTEFCQGYTKRWGIAWTFLPMENSDLSTAPVIRTRAEVLKQKLHQKPPMEIVFPAREELSSVEDVVNVLKRLMTELNVETKEIKVEDEDQSCWACRLTAHEDTWTHARRKRRMAMRQNDKSKRVKNSDESEEPATRSESSIPDSDNSGITNKTEAHESSVIRSKEPWLVTTLLVGEIEDEEESDADDEDSVAETLRICLIFESGVGGKLAVESLRQYLVNRLNVREYFRKQQPSKANRRKRKRLQKSATAQVVGQESTC